MSSSSPAPASAPGYSILERLGLDDDGPLPPRPTSPTLSKDPSNVVRTAIYDMPAMGDLRQHLRQADDLANAYISLGTAQLSQATRALSIARADLTARLAKLRAADEQIAAETQRLVEQTSRRLGDYGVRDEAGNRIPLEKTLNNVKAQVSRAELRFAELRRASEKVEGEIRRVLEVIEGKGRDGVLEGIEGEVVRAVEGLEGEGRVLVGRAEEEIDELELEFQRKKDDYIQEKIIKLESLRSY